MKPRVWAKVAAAGLVGVVALGFLAKPAVAPEARTEPDAVTAPVEGAVAEAEVASRADARPRKLADLKLDVEAYRPSGRRAPPATPTIAREEQDDMPRFAPPGAIGGPIPETLKPEKDRWAPLK